jgi:hypothetical protein
VYTRVYTTIRYVEFALFRVCQRSHEDHGRGRRDC